MTWGERVRVAGEILSSYVLVRWWLVRRTFPEAVAAVRAPENGASGMALSPEIALRLGQTVERTLRVLPFDSKCLIRSLVLTRMLCRRGVKCALVIGVRTNPEFAAHAWVEREGVPLLPTSADFQRLTEM